MRAYADKDLLVIGPDGEQLGVMKLGPACQAAKDAGLDLVMVAETSEPPVCRIMNFGKLLYEQKKKLKDQKKNQQAQKVKEIKFRLNIAEHDYAHKIEQGVEFLNEGCKLKVTITFKGRELVHPEMGFELVERITEDLGEDGTVESPAKLLGKNINVTFNPKGTH
jgi:translation initiation factor IF-3